MFFSKFSWKNLRPWIVYMNPTRFFAVTGTFGFIFVGSSVGVVLFYYYSLWVKFIFGFSALLALAVGSAFIVYSRIHSVMWAKGELQRIDREINERSRQVRDKTKKAKEE